MIYNVLKVVFRGKTSVESRPLYQYDYGQKIKFIDLYLPAAYEVHFSNRLKGVSTIQIGDEDGVIIPNKYLQTGLPIYAWVYLHQDQNDGETEYMVTIPVIQRASFDNEIPTTEEANAIGQAIQALDSAVAAISSYTTAAIDAATNASFDCEATHSYMELTQGYVNDLNMAVASGSCLIIDAETMQTVISAKDDAVSAKSSAIVEKNEAISAKNEAVAAKNDAVSAKNSAEAARDAILDLTASASVGSNVGTPSVVVSVTEENGHKNMAFAFDNLKGDKGDTGEVTETELTEKLAEKMPNVTYGTPVVLVDTTTVSFSKDGDNDWYISTVNPINNITFNDNILYKIIWDDIEYDCFYSELYLLSQTQSGDYSFSFVGNLNIIGNDNIFQTNAPFLITKHYKQNEPDNIYIFTLNNELSHIIKIITIPYTKTIISKQLYEEISEGRPATYIGSGKGSTILNYGARARGTGSIAGNKGTKALGNASTAFGSCTNATAYAAHAEGVNTTASGTGSHAEGVLTVASGLYAHTEGQQTVASAGSTHAEGQQTTASGGAAHAEGQKTQASGAVSHAEGDRAIASGGRSHAEGSYTVANHFAQHAFGQYNIADPSTAIATERGNYVEIVGNGTADDARSNARTLDWNGNEAIAGGLTLGLGTEDEVTITPQQLKALLEMLN